MCLPFRPRLHGNVRAIPVHAVLGHGEPAEAKLKLKDRKFTIVDIMGNAAARRTKRGVATVRLTSSPVFIPATRLDE